MLSAILRDGEARVAESRAEAGRSLQRARQELMDWSDRQYERVNADARQMYLAEAALDGRVKELDQAVNALSLRLERWATLLWKFNSELKELGDVEHWVAGMASDLDQTLDAIEAAHHKLRQPQDESQPLRS